MLPCCTEIMFKGYTGSKGYTGKTVTQLRTRINGHRALFYKIIADPDLKFINRDSLKFNNDLSLAFHLYKEHGKTQRADFNSFFKFTIIQHCSPETIDASEHKWIHRLKTLEPGGINAVNPFGIPLVR